MSNMQDRSDLKWVVVPTLSFLLLWSVAGVAQDTQTEVRCILEVSSAEILPYEPLTLLVSLSNQVERVLDVSFLPSASARLGTRNDGEIMWTDAFGGRAPQGRPLPLRKASLLPHEQLRLVRHTHYDAPFPRLAMVQKPGVVYVQGMIYAMGQHLKSEPVKVSILEPTGADAEAYEYLRTVGTNVPPEGLHHYFSQQGAYGWTYSEETMKQVLDFASRFPNSRYSLHAKLGAGLMWLYESSGHRDLDKSATLLEQVAKSGNQALSAQAYYYLGQVAEERKDIAAAERYYSTALLLNLGPYFKYLAEGARSNIQAVLNRQPSPKDPLESLREDVRSMGYNMDELWQDETLDEKWFNEVLLATEQAVGAGKVPENQFGAELARRTKAFVLEHLKPTLTNAPPTTSTTNLLSNTSTTNSLLSTTNSAPTTSP